MKRLLLTLGIWLALAFPAKSATNVWLMYGMGDNFLGTSSGIDTIARRARAINGVGSVRVFNYYQTQEIANEIMASSSHDKAVVGGYSCGANSAPTIAYGLYGHRHVYVVGIQESLWCGGYPLLSNTPAAQETYGGCIITLGFGCKRYRAASGHHVPIRLIRRNDLHGWADEDPRAQGDVLRFINAVAKGRI